jgi:topoisomerase-4 subunit A
MIYKDGRGGASYVKRFNVTGVTRDKMYDLTTGKPQSEILYFTANPNGEAEVVTVNLRQSGSIKKLKWDLDFADVLIKGRNSKGNIVTKYPVKRIELKEKGLSTLKPRKIWFDDTIQRLNVDGRGELLGEFTSEDRLLIINQKGEVKTAIPDLIMRFDDDMIVLEKWKPEKPLSAIYWEGEKELFYVKRFLVENPDREEVIITDHPKSYLEKIFTDYRPMAEVVFAKKRGHERKENMVINLEEFIAVKGITAMGNQLTKEKVLEINALDPLPYEEPSKNNPEDIEVVDEEDITADKNDSESNSGEKSEDDDTDGQIKLF